MQCTYSFMYKDPRRAAIMDECMDWDHIKLRFLYISKAEKRECYNIISSNKRNFYNEEKDEEKQRSIQSFKEGEKGKHRYMH